MNLNELVLRTTGAHSVTLGEKIQTLWSGYGVIQRATLVGLSQQEVVVKHIDLSNVRTNRRGWGGDTSHQRKVRSYEVEKAFYESYAKQCSANCRVPKFIAAHEKENEQGWIIVLEDLNASGFDLRKGNVGRNDINACLKWLAHFHATFMHHEGRGLWPIGTYWHLDTRADELAAMPQGPLKSAASKIDQRLNEARFQTLVHGDAKLANFCFSSSRSNEVAGVDFQYVGRGCGMKDVAYFISSCLHDDEAAEQQDSLLSFYFHELQEAIAGLEINVTFDSLEAEWRELYSFAWADFCRFLAGWSPGHWKLNDYNDRITQSVLSQINDHS